MQGSPSHGDESCYSAKSMSLQNWLLPKICDYWDSTRSSVEKFSLEIAMAPPEVRTSHLACIREAITEHVRVLPERILLDVLMVTVEDLYKEGNRAQIVERSVFEYLDASANTLFTLATQRKCAVHYLVDNIFEYTESGMMRPLTLYRDWFRSAGLVYVCPQLYALETMVEADRQDPRVYFDLLPRYIDEGNHIANKVVEGCHAESRSYAFVNASNSPDPFDFGSPKEAVGSPGVVTVVRCEAPVVGSKCHVIYPGAVDSK